MGKPKSARDDHSRPPGYLELLRAARAAPGTDQVVAQHWIEHHIAEFTRTKNPVFVWEAIHEALGAGIELPLEARRYLLESAANIGHLSRNAQPKKNHVARAVAQALNFAGGRGRSSNPFGQLARPGEEIGIALDVYECHTAHRSQAWGMRAVFEDVAARHSLSVANVKRFWYAHAFKVIPRYLIERSSSRKIDDIMRQPSSS